MSTPTSYPSKRALRVVYFAPSYAHTVPFLMNAKTLPVSVIYFDIWKGLAPSPLRNIFTRSDEIHRYNTRHAIKTIIIRKRQSWKFQALAGAKVWNLIPSDWRDPSKFIFKRKNRGFLFDTLLDRDDYVEVDV